MRNIFLCSLLIFMTFGLTMSDASAGRFGGGRGFSMMRSKSMFNQAPRAQRATMNKARPANKWRGALTGLLIGSLLTSLFMGHGFGCMLFSWLLVGMAIYLVVGLIRRKNHQHCTNCK